MINVRRKLFEKKVCDVCGFQFYRRALPKGTAKDRRVKVCSIFCHWVLENSEKYLNGRRKR